MSTDEQAIRDRADAHDRYSDREWTGGPDWAFHALQDRRDLLAELDRLRGNWNDETARSVGYAADWPPFTG